jgi:hypothetical protein
VVHPMSLSPAERKALAVVRPNLMLIGSGEAVGPLLRELHACLVPPVCVWRGDSSSRALPDDCSTLIVQDASRLSIDSQADLLAWIRAHRGRAQVITVSSRPLLPQVDDGSFAADLYYALNTLYFVLADPAAGQFETAARVESAPRRQADPKSPRAAG